MSRFDDAGVAFPVEADEHVMLENRGWAVKND